MRSAFYFPRRFILSLLVCHLCIVSLVGQLEREHVNVVMDGQSTFQSTMADLDGDGDLDVLGSRWGRDGHLVVYEMLDDQLFYAEERIFGDTAWEGRPDIYTRFELADMDNDDDLDIICQAEARNPLPYWANDGTAHFSRPAAAPEGTVLNYQFRVADFNQDGWQDVFFYFTIPQSIAFNWNNGSGEEFTFIELPEIELPPHNQLREIAVIDFDQDQDNDLVLFYERNEGDGKSFHMLLLAQDCGAGCFSVGLEQELAVSDGRFNFVEANQADFDQDGWLDLVVSYSTYYEENTTYTNEMSLLQNENGSGNFALASTLPFYIEQAVADVDQDGWPDLYAVHDDNFAHGGSADEMYAKHWLRNTGDFTFEVNVIDNLYTGFSITAADLDQDGLTDLISTGDFSTQPVNYWNRLTSTTGDWDGPQALRWSPGFMQDIQLTDWDGDGDLDILGTNDSYDHGLEEDVLVWFENQDGAGNYSYPELIFNLPEGYNSTAYLDLNEDGRLDLIGKYLEQSVVPNRLQLFYLLTAANPEDFELELLNVIEPTYSDIIEHSDLDGDGDEDLVVMDQNERVAVLWNEFADGNGLVEDEDFLPIPEIGYSLLHGDIDQDGRADLVFYNNYSIYWALQTDNSGSFSPWTQIDPGPGIILGEVIQGDFDGDGDLDLRYQLREDNLSYNWVAINFDQSTQEYFAPLPTEIDVSFSQSLDFAIDLNGDQIADHVGEQGFRLSIPGLGFPAAPFVPTPFTTTVPTHFYAYPQLGDLDQDGEQELATTQMLWYDLNFLPEQAIQGLIVWDSLGNCQFDSLFTPLANWPLRITSDEVNQVLSTNASGQYAALVPSAATQHHMEPLPPSSYWGVCPIDTILTGPLAGQVTTVNFAAVANTLCPLLRVDLVTTPIRQCFNSTVVVNYENVGTLAAENAQVTLSFDPRFEPVSSSIPWNSSTDSTLIFDFSQIAVGESGSIVLEFEPDCENLILDEEVCFRANIFPFDLCDDEMNSQWSGAQLEAQASCESDSVAFCLTNTGVGAMTEPQTYRVHIVNDDIVIFLQGDVQLDPDEEMIIRVPLIDENLRFSIEQPTGHPFPEPISLLQSACSTTPNEADLSLPNMEGDPFSALVCRPVIGPYDPNIKEATPAGLGPDHLIEVEWPLHYTIHFQNTGTDMARTVVLRDTLSPLLDLASFRPSASSHNCDWQILPNGVLVVSYPNINLPDSTANEAGSHGFFSYDIQALATAPPLSLIENRAGIYFDFNPPIITNTTQHTIRKPRTEFVEYAAVCVGEMIQDLVVQNDTIIQYVEEFSDREEVYVLHVEALPTAQIFIPVTLEAPDFWQGVFITQDTSIIEIGTTINGCDSLTIYEVDVLTHTDEPVWLADIEMGPIPATEMVYLSWPAELNLRTIKVRNMMGQMISAYSVSRQVNFQIPISNLPNGTYLLEIQDQQRRRGQLHFTKIGP